MHVIDRYASLQHYADHTDPVWLALPEDARGASWAPSRSIRGAECWNPAAAAQRGAQALLVASWPDAVSAAGRGRALVYLEHGAGQSYDGDPAMAGAAGWSGARARGLEGVRLFLCPNETVAQRWRDLHQVPAVAIGCPKLDPWHAGARPRPERPAVAITFHWDCPLGPETRSAWSWWDRALPELVQWCRRRGVDVLGHGHPRLWSRIARRWASLGVEPVPELADVFDRATVLVADNTSAMYEFASLDRPVVALNVPWYRRDVEHGLRFWSHVPGEQVNHRGLLVPAVEAALDDPGATSGLRAAATGAAYAACDGQAAARAAAAIMETMP